MIADRYTSMPKSAQMLIRMEPSMVAALDQLSRVTGESKNHIVRSCIRERLAKTKRQARKLIAAERKARRDAQGFLGSA